MLSLFSVFLYFLCAFVVKNAFVLLHFRRFAPLQPLQRHPKWHAVALREQSAALSGISRASRHAKLSIQRHEPSFPPVISAGNMQNLQQLP